MKILRPVFAIIAGIIVMVVVVALVEAVGHAMFPPPQEVIDTVMAYYEVSTTGDPETVAAAREARNVAIADYLRDAPVGALLFVVSAWIVGSFVGGGVAALTDRRNAVAFALAVGLVDVFGIVYTTQVDISHPLWMPVVGVAGVVVAALAAGKILEKRKVDAVESPEAT